MVVETGMFRGCATRDDVQKRYRALCKHLHPDTGGDGRLFQILTDDHRAALETVAAKTPKAKPQEFPKTPPQQEPQSPQPPPGSPSMGAPIHTPQPVQNPLEGFLHGIRTARTIAMEIADAVHDFEKTWNRVARKRNATKKPVSDKKRAPSGHKSRSDETKTAVRRRRS